MCIQDLAIEQYEFWRDNASEEQKAALLEKKKSSVNESLWQKPRISTQKPNSTRDKPVFGFQFLNVTAVETIYLQSDQQKRSPKNEIAFIII